MALKPSPSPLNHLVHCLTDPLNLKCSFKIGCWQMSGLYYCALSLSLSVGYRDQILLSEILLNRSSHVFVLYGAWWELFVDMFKLANVFISKAGKNFSFPLGLVKCHVT